MNAQPDLWPTLRSALAETTQRHWHALRAIASSADPRLVAAEAVAAAALAYIQEPATWIAAQLILAAEGEHPDQAALIAASAGIDARDLTSALRRLEVLDMAARTWSEAAYQRQHRRRA